jgi:hypothetical protein
LGWVQPLLDGCIRDPARENEDREHDHDLSSEDPPPREVRRTETTDQRADGDRDRSCRGDQPVRGGPPLGREVPRDQRHDGRQDQRCADALQERPAEEQHREALRNRGRERPAAVDHAADRERTLAADDRPDLGTRDHQRRHHERVCGDRTLDPGHRRPDVLRDCRDRDVHHRAVERHEELPGRKSEQDDGRCSCGSAG